MLSKLTVYHTYSILEQKTDPQIILNWKADKVKTVPLNQVKAINRTPTKQQKAHSTNSDDFVQ
jgi:hypothetical protein